MAGITKDARGYIASRDLARYRWAYTDDTIGSIRTAGVVEAVLVLDQILVELKILNARLGCPNFIAIPTYLRGIARDANRRNRRVDEQAKAKRRATRRATKTAQAKGRG